MLHGFCTTLRKNARASGSPVVDACMHFLCSIGRSCALEEGFTPATHDTGWGSVVALAQAEADALAAKGRASATVPSIPFANKLPLRGVLLHIKAIF